MSTFDYYYGDESSQFSFCRIPRQIITGPEFKKLSNDAKLLYALMLERMGISAKKVTIWNPPRQRLGIRQCQ